MTYLMNALALPLTISLALGLLIGWLTANRKGTDDRRSWLPLGLTVFAIGCYAATVHIVPGREGFWLETGLMLFAAYVLGCAIGSATHLAAGGPELQTASGLAAAGSTIAQVASAPAAKAGPDDLTLIWGVGEKLARTLNGMGVSHFEQIAHWSPEDICQFENHSPEFRGRVDRDQWTDQCRRLADGWRPQNAAGDRLDAG